MNNVQLDNETFTQFADLIYEKAGIYLSSQKQALVSSRLGKRMRKLGLNDYRAYYKHIRDDETDTELVHLLDAISTNVTQFYREPRHFDLFRDLLNRWEKEGQRRFRFWSAGCSSGEEPYTIAITARKTLQSVQDTKILATDISSTILEQARRGEYEPKRIEQVPDSVLRAFFRKYTKGGNTVYQITEDISSMITFARLNLATPPFPMQGPLDVVFCRNVMIYFDNEVRRRLLNEIYRLLKPGGYLMVGHSESLSGILSEFKVVEPAVYRKD
mgnify:CR=1 FL=1